MQSSSMGNQGLASQLSDILRHWPQTTPMTLQVRVPSLTSPFIAEFHDTDGEKMLELTDDSWDHVLGMSRSDSEDRFHLGVQGWRRILWKPQDQTDEAALIVQDGYAVMVNDLHCGLLQVSPSYGWILETAQLLQWLNQALAALPDRWPTSKTALSAHLDEQGKVHWETLGDAVRIEGPACSLDSQAIRQLAQGQHSRETAQLDVISLLDPQHSQGSSAVFRMFVLVCSNRHQTFREFQFRSREDLITGLFEGLQHFFAEAGIPARLQLNRPLFQFVLMDLARELDIQLVMVDHLILTEQLSEELEAAFQPLISQEA